MLFKIAGLGNLVPNIIFSNLNTFLVESNAQAYGVSSQSFDFYKKNLKCL
jgi:hypothetical protein